MDIDTMKQTRWSKNDKEDIEDHYFYMDWN